MIKIYEFGPDYVAATNLRDAVRELIRENGCTIREALEEGILLDDKALDTLVFLEDIYNPTECNRWSFRTHLNKMINDGTTFPTMFASSEY